MKKIFLIIIPFFVFIPFVSASVTFEEIKTELESKYGDSIQVEGSLKSGHIAFDPYNDRQVINISDNIFTNIFLVIVSLNFSIPKKNQLISSIVDNIYKV